VATVPDLIFVAVFAFIGPLVDYAVFWSAHRRLTELDPAWARMWGWKSAIGNAWLLAALGAAIWIANGRSWTLFGFTVPDGWRLWVAIGLVSLVAGYYTLAAVSVARNAATRET
jgi:uncharacterized protein